MVHSHEKQRCEKCKRNLCITHFKHKSKVCEGCIKKIPTNPFYIPKGQRRVFYGMTQDEKLELHAQHMRNGLCTEEAWKKVDYLNYWLKMHRKRYRKPIYTKEDFLKGLNQI